MVVSIASTAWAGVDKDIVDTAIAAGSFKTLVAAVGKADLVETLKGPGPFTVFAPTDEAFAKLPEGALEDLLKPANRSKLAEERAEHVLLFNLIGDPATHLWFGRPTRAALEVSAKKDGSLQVSDDGESFFMLYQADEEKGNRPLMVVERWSGS